MKWQLSGFRILFLVMLMHSCGIIFCQDSSSCLPEENSLHAEEGADIGKDKLLFIVQRNSNRASIPEKTLIALSWNEVLKRLPSLKNNAFLIKEHNFGKNVTTTLADINNDSKPDFIVLDFIFSSNEPIYTFSIEPFTDKVNLTNNPVQPDENLTITFLTSYRQLAKKGKVITNWPDKIIGSTMQFYPDPRMISLYAPDHWSYEYGFFLNAMFAQWKKTNNSKYFDYIKKWADRFIDAQGRLDTKFYRMDEFKLDDILPGRLLISLYEVTKEEKYKRAANTLKEHLLRQPKTSDGGYWHKQIYPYQMWLDGIYMADIFSTQYAATFQEPEFFDEAIHQIKLIATHTTDPVTGLMYHGWDESKNKVWAHPENGTSPEFWGRAIGWYMMALVECLEYIPESHPERKDVIIILQNLSQSLIRYQDKKSCLWYQVINKGDQPGNWIETSCSAMFTYAFAKAHRNGWLDNSYYTSATKAFDALVNQYVYFDDEGKLYLDKTVKIGTLNIKTSKGDFDYYINTECRINDYKGLAALLYASLEVQ